MKKIIHFLAGLLMLASAAYAQNPPQFKWAINGGSIDMGANALTERVQNMASDQHGNLYLTSPVFRNNISVAGATLPDGHDYQFTDILLSSISCSGTYRWSKVIGGIGGEEAPYIKISPSGQVYLAGYVSRNNSMVIDFDTDTTLAATGYQTLFIAQYDTLGNMNWLRLLQSDTVTNWSFSRSQLMDIDIDTLGNVYALCKFPPGSALSGSSLTIPPGTGASTMHILKYSGAGILQSVTPLDMRFNNTGANALYLRRHPASGNYYINGLLVPFPPYNDTLYLGSNKINTIMYLSCYSPSGQLLWYKQNTYSSGLNNTLAQSAVQIDEQGDIYLAGQGAHGDSFNGYAFTNPLGNTVADVVPFVMKMNASGTPIWTSSGYSNPFSITNQLTINNNKVALGGTYGNLLVWNNDTIRNGTGNGQDGWITILDKNSGQLQHIDTIPGPSLYDAVTALHYHDANLYLGGYFQSAIKAGNHTATSNGGSSDFFVAKYGYACGCIPPSAAFSYQVNGTSATFQNTTAGQVDSLRWYFGDGQSGTQTNPTHTYNAAGSYNACLVTYNSCDRDSTCQTITIATGIRDVPAVFPAINIYPNPVYHTLMIDGAETGMKWSCYELSGKLLRQHALKKGSNKIELGTLSGGVYLIKITHTDGRHAITKMIKM